jgi:hypothetical protein
VIDTCATRDKKKGKRKRGKQEEHKPMSEREQLIYELNKTPDVLVREVLKFLLFIRARSGVDIQESISKPDLESSNIPNFLSFIDRLNSETPAEDNEKLPRDFAKNLDHYLYGSLDGVN